MKNWQYLDKLNNIKFNFDKKSQIFWIGLIQTPSTQQIDNLVEIIKLKNNFILYIQHIEENSLSPTFHLIFHILNHLTNNKNLIKNNLILQLFNLRECPIFKVVKI